MINGVLFLVLGYEKSVVFILTTPPCSEASQQPDCIVSYLIESPILQRIEEGL